MGSPLAALFSASRIGRGNVTRPLFGRPGAVRFAVVVDAGSFELQLDAPNAASSPSEITVHAMRKGVQNLTLLTSFFISDIVTTLLLFAKSERLQNHRRLASFTDIFHRRQLWSKRCTKKTQGCACCVSFGAGGQEDNPAPQLHVTVFRYVRQPFPPEFVSIHRIDLRRTL